MDEWIKKMWCVYKQYYFVIKKKVNYAVCDHMDETWGYYAIWNKSEKDKYYMITLI